MKKFIAVLLAAIMMTGSLCVAASAAAVMHTQTHTVSDYKNKYAQYEGAYLSGAGKAMDGTDGLTDLCIPGLNNINNMIPQGMTYWQSKNRIIISAYPAANASSTQSVLYVIDLSSGKLLTQFGLQDSTGAAFSGHVGGIAAGNYNLYLTNGKKLHYIPLSDLDKATGTVTDVKLRGSFTMPASITNGSCSYLSYGDGILWTGNFYHPTESAYNTPANSSYNSLIIGFRLSGNSSADEWASLSGKTQADCTISVDNSINKIQGVAYGDGKMYISSSYGRKNESTLYYAKVDLDKNERIKRSNISSCTNMPMSEAMFWHNGSLYCLYESGAYYYNGYTPTSTATNPTDVIWKIDTSALRSSSSSSSSNGALSFIEGMMSFFRYIGRFIEKIVEFFSRLDLDALGLEL